MTPFDFERCVLLNLVQICYCNSNRLKLIDRAGFVQATFALHTNYGGVSVFSLLKKC